MSSLFPTDASKIVHALSLWANYIETGNPSLSATDSKNCYPDAKVKALSHEQMKFVVELREPADKERQKR